MSTQLEEDSLLEILRETSPERSLLLSYAAPPLVIESLLLGRLQRRGVGVLTVLVDERSYRDALLEPGSAQWAGVHYTYAPVRLPRRAAAFHPKVYLLLRALDASLWVSSANLTPSSLHENAETIDRLYLDQDGTGDVEAFQDLLDLLLSLADLPGALPEGARGSVLQFVERLEPWALQGRSGTGARLLHSIRQPLMEQLTAHASPQRVQEIVAVSPFFDPQGAALHALARAYPHATIRLVMRRGEPTDLTPAHVDALGGRLTLHGYEHPDGRRLHGKAILLRGDGEQWLVTGSANLTRPAWLETASERGNVEAVVLRHSEDAGAFHAFGPGIPSTPLSVAELISRLPAGEDADADTSLPLRIVSAEEQDGELRVRVEPSPSRAARVRLRIEAPGRLAELATRIEDVNGPVHIRAALPGDLTDVESALVVHAEVDDPPGPVRHGATWVQRPALSRHSARERRWRRMVARLDQLGWSEDPEDYQTLLELWHASTEGVHPSDAVRTAAPQMALVPSAAATAAETAGLDRVPDRTLVERAADALFRSLCGEDEAGLQEEAARLRTGGSRLGRASAPRVTREDRQNQQLDRWLLERIPVLFRRTPAEEAIDDLVLQLDLLLRVLLRRYTARASRSASDEAFLVSVLRKAMAQAFAVSGAETGRPDGWIVRAWRNPFLRAPLRDALASPERQAVVLVSFALVLGEAPDHPDRRGQGHLRGDLAGFALGCAATPWTSEATRAQVARLVDGIAEVSGIPLGPEAVHERLGHLLRQPVGLLAAAHRYLELIRYCRGEPVTLRKGALEERVRQLRARPGKPTLALVYGCAQPSCGACFRAVPLGILGQVQTAGDDAICPHCGVVLVPFSPDDTSLQELLAALEREDEHHE
jgi:hypothetical protein